MGGATDELCYGGGRRSDVWPAAGLYVPETITAGGFGLWEGKRFKVTLGSKLREGRGFKTTSRLKLLGRAKA